jgi:3-oxoacyl-[acyl-carrier protein] reductase
MSESKPLAGRSALVTGSSTGIGRAIASQLARQGASLVLHGRTPSNRLQETADSIRQLGGGVSWLTADFSSIEQLQSFLGEAWELNGGIDILVNNAGVDVLTGEFSNESFADKFERLWQVDVRATLLACRIVGRNMKQQNRPYRRSILNIGWDQAWQGMAGDAGEMFAASKGAIMSLTKSLAQSLAPEVRVNCLAPGWIKTKWGESASTKWSDRAARESLMNRWGTPSDIANVAAFVSSDQADFISGQVIPVNGGFRYFCES